MYGYTGRGKQFSHCREVVFRVSIIGGSTVFLHCIMAHPKTTLYSCPVKYVL